MRDTVMHITELHTELRKAWNFDLASGSAGSNKSAEGGAGLSSGGFTLTSTSASSSTKLELSVMRCGLTDFEAMLPSVALAYASSLKQSKYDVESNDPTSRSSRLAGDLVYFDVHAGACILPS